MKRKQLPTAHQPSRTNFGLAGRGVATTILFLIALLVGPNAAVPAVIEPGNDLLQDGRGADQLSAEEEDDDDLLTGTQDQDALNFATASTASASGKKATIWVGPSAKGKALRILSTAYALSPLSGCSPLDSRCNAHPIVVGPADLSTPWIVDRLKAAYEAGHAVALTNATTAHIERLRSLLEHRGSAEPVPGGAEVALVAFRKAQRSDGQFHFSSHILLPRAAAATTTTSPLNERIKKAKSKSLRRKLRKELAKVAKKQEQKQRRLADRTDIQALSRVFSAKAEVPEVPPLGSSPQQNLINLAESYQSHGIQSDSYGNQVQLVNTVWAARSFTNSADLYYVLQETDYHIVNVILQGGFPYNLKSWTNNVNSLPSEPNPTLIQPSPQTTMEATVDTSTVSHTIGGSAGWNQQQGLDASISGSVTISNSKSTIIPPINITNNANLVNGQTNWIYAVNELPNQPETIDLFSQWIWSIPFSDYQSGQTQFQFSCQANLSAVWLLFVNIGTPISANLSVNLTSNVPLPFGQTFALQPPAVTGLSATSVAVGEPFTIQGTGFYPSLVQAVLIGGIQVNQDNITTVSDTQIKVIAPPPTVSNATVAVVTTQATSNTNFTITID